MSKRCNKCSNKDYTSMSAPSPFISAHPKQKYIWGGKTDMILWVVSCFQRQRPNWLWALNKHISTYCLNEWPAGFQAANTNWKVWEKFTDAFILQPLCINSRFHHQIHKEVKHPVQFSPVQFGLAKVADIDRVFFPEFVTKILLSIPVESHLFYPRVTSKQKSNKPLHWTQNDLHKLQYEVITAQRWHIGILPSITLAS